MKQELTPWFSSEQVPARDGVYQTRPVVHPKKEQIVWHSVYRDGKWRGATACGIETAIEYDCLRGYVSEQPYEWRGLANPPKEA